MKKNNIFSIVLSFSSIFAFVACGSNTNTNMTDSNADSTIDAVKWDQFAEAVGLPTTSQAPPGTDMGAVVKNLSIPPANFQPADSANPADPKNLPYLAVVKAVNAYVGSMAKTTQAANVTSIQNYGAVLNNLYTNVQNVSYTQDPNNSSCQLANFYSVPFRDRNGCQVDLSANPTSSGVTSTGTFKIYGTKNGLLNTAESASGTVYVVTYTLKSDSTHQTYTALVTVPSPPSAAVRKSSSTPSGYPLMLFAHGGDAGLSFRNIATIVQKDLGKVILAAANYPGEPICPVTQRTDSSPATHFQRSCIDNSGHVVAPAVAAVGQKSPLHQDVVAFLGLQNAISNMALATPGFITDSSVNTPNSPAYILNNDLQNSLNFYLPAPAAKSPLPGPQTIGAAESRGGAVLLAAMGREGIMFNNMMNGLQDFVTPVLFSSAILYYSPTSMLVGQFRLITQYLMAGEIKGSSSFNALPMVPDLKKNTFFMNYHTQKRGQDRDEMNSLIGWIGASDITYLAPFLSVSTESWGHNSLIGTMNIIFPFFNDLSNVVPGTTSHKSLFNYYSDALLSPLSVSTQPQCNIDGGNFTGDCTIRGIFLKGLIGGSIPGLSAPVPSIPPLLNADDSASVQGLASFLNTLGNHHNGFASIASLLGNYNKVNFYTNNVQVLLPNLITAFGIVSLVARNDPYLQSLPTAENNPVTSLATDQVAAVDFGDFAGTNPNAIIHHMSTPPPSSLPGSIIFLHGTQDTVVPFTESVIGKSAADAVFDNVYGTLAHSSPLVQNAIPALGSQLYSFQPDKVYYNMPVGTTDPYGHVLCVNQNADGTVPVNYNPTVNKCFGNFQGSATGEGNADHGDSAFFTGHLVNGAMRNMNLASDPSDYPTSPLGLEMRYGADSVTGATYSTGSVSEQLNYFNTAYTANAPQGASGAYPYDADSGNPVNCTNLAEISGVCYLVGFLNSPAVRVNPGDMPLFNRTMYQDETMGFGAMYTGAYDPLAQTMGILAPADIMSAWLGAVVFGKVLKE